MCGSQHSTKSIFRILLSNLSETFWNETTVMIPTLWRDCSLQSDQELHCLPYGMHFWTQFTTSKILENYRSFFWWRNFSDFYSMCEPQHEKTTKWSACPAKTQITWASAQSDQSSLCTQWIAKDQSFLHEDSNDSDQSGWMPRLIWVFAGCTGHFVGFVIRRLM